MPDPQSSGQKEFVPAAVIAGVLVLLGVVAWQVKSIDIPGISDDDLPILSDEPAEQLAAGGPQEQCVDAWNKEKHEEDWFQFALTAAATTDGKAAVTVDEQGVCVVAVPSTVVTSSGEDNGVTLSYERGSWDYYAFIGHEEYSTDPAELTESQGEFSARSALIDELEAQALAEPNASLLPDGSLELLTTTPGLPDPDVQSPESAPCDETAGFLDGLGTLEIEEASGISCAQAAKVAGSVPDPGGWACALADEAARASCEELASAVESPLDPERWSCEGRERVVCEDGGFSFVFSVSLSSPSTPPPPPGEPLEQDCGETETGIDVSASGISCEEALALASFPEGGSFSLPEGYECSGNTGQLCQMGDVQVYFGLSGD